jgi:hypothetical protein
MRQIAALDSSGPHGVRQKWGTAENDDSDRQREIVTRRGRDRWL